MTDRRCFAVLPPTDGRLGFSYLRCMNPATRRGPLRRRFLPAVGRPVCDRHHHRDAYLYEPDGV